mgnify:CR=1 FL=1
MSATPRPWTVVRREPGPRGAGGGYDIFDARNFPILILPDGEVNKQKAHDIIHAVNLLDVMEEAKKVLEDVVNLSAPLSMAQIEQARAVLVKLKKEDFA